MFKQTNSRKGMASMEMALLLPLLLALTMIIIEGGIIFYSWMTIQKAAQSGSRLAATGKGDEDGTRLALITAETEHWLERLNSGSKEITISSWPGQVASGNGTAGNAGGPCQLVEVAVVYNYHPFTPIVGDMLPEIIKLRGFDRKLNEPWKPCDD